MRSVKHILLVFLSISLIMTQIPFGTFADDAVSEDRQESITIENNDPETDPVSDERRRQPDEGGRGRGERQSAYRLSQGI